MDPAAQPADHGIRVASFCTGGAGLDLGVGLALRGTRTVVYVEVEAFAITTLVQKMEDGLLDPAPLWTDCRTFDSAAWRGCVDLVLGGYPCQPFSQAGQRRGEDDPRHLWPHLRRHIEALRPSYVFCENVSAHLSKGFDTVIGELHELGYRVAATLLTAAEVGAPHKRERLFFLAERMADRDRDRVRLSISGERDDDHGSDAPGNDAHGRGEAVGHTDGAVRGAAWSGAQRGVAADGASKVLADADAVGRAERLGNVQAREPHTDGRGTSVADTGCSRGAEQNSEHGTHRPRRTEPRGVRSAVDGAVAQWYAGLSYALRDALRDESERGLGPARAQDPWDAFDGAPGATWRLAFPPAPYDLDGWRRYLDIYPGLEPALRRGAYGLAHRLDELRMLGNGVVPLMAAVALARLHRALRAGPSDGVVVLSGEEILWSRVAREMRRTACTA